MNTNQYYVIHKIAMIEMFTLQYNSVLWPYGMLLATSYHSCLQDYNIVSEIYVQYNKWTVMIIACSAF